MLIIIIVIAERRCRCLNEYCRNLYGQLMTIDNEKAENYHNNRILSPFVVSFCTVLSELEQIKTLLIVRVKKHKKCVIFMK